MAKRKEKEITIVMGDLNAKAGNDISGYGNAMGIHGLGKMNENGEFLANFCVEHSYRRYTLPTQGYTQNYMGISRPKNREPD